ncbi:protein cornichon homolog 1-like isoform X1 [Populus nigra]|uniref:protein cornichon homolog 1-like isoform X1 n=1 Tax=Populus nigra TaxID=3691 RepID=UPI002B26CB6B|nr:protein cornichon homolog 1-like isoform X1 [Populus nigra]
MWNLIFWIICLLINSGLLAIVFYALLCLTDLEVDQMDPFVATANINRWILLEFALQAALSILLLFTGHWILFLAAVPLTCYHAMLFIRRQHLIDVTEVFRNLNTDKKRRMIKLGVYMIFFTICVFRIGAGILSLFNSEELDIHSSFFEF